MGVVTSATLRSHEMGPVWVDRLVVGLDALATYFQVAPALPRETTMGAVLGWTPLSPGEPVLFVYTACSSVDDTAVARARAATSAVAAGSRLGADLPVGVLGATTWPGCPSSRSRARTAPIPSRSGCPSLGTARVARSSASPSSPGRRSTPPSPKGSPNHIRAAPTPMCRIDFQHTGGALADVGDTDTAFWGRSGEWNIPLNAIWTEADDDLTCTTWARDTLRSLDAYRLGVYSVELRPGFPETSDEAAAAYGGNRPRLLALRERHDPTGILGQLPL